MQSGASCVLQCARKGASDEYSIHVLVQWLERIGHKRVILQTDNEPSIRAVARAVKKKCSADIILRTSLVGSSASLGVGETIQGIIAGQFGTLKAELESNAKISIGLNSALVPWLVRHGPWARTRFKQGHDGLTAYSRLNGSQYMRGLPVW
jgi:hypothetical protein